MSKPDRWQREVERAFSAGLDEGEVFKRENWNLIEVHEATRLLRQQHAAVRRKVKVERKYILNMSYLNRSDRGRGWKAGYVRACDDLLAWLNARGK